jgi:hypothetical protein
MEQAPVTRTCIKCGETKVLELFEKDSSKKLGTRGTCKKCRNEAKRHYNRAPTKKKKKVDRPIKHQEPPIVKTCTDCKETKEIELFKTNNARKFGRCSICKKCDSLRSKKYSKPKKPYLNHAEPPSIITCIICKQTKESQFFVRDKYKKFGIRGRCKECEKIKSKNCYVKCKEKEEKLFKDNILIDKLIRTCPRCNETKPLSFFIKKISGKLGRSSYCKECDYERQKSWIESKPSLYKEKVKEQKKQSYKKGAETLSKSYLKSILRTKFKLLTKDITEEQLQLQKESILLHREYEQLKLFFQEPEVQKELQREKEEVKLLLEQRPLVRTCTKCRETKQIELFANSKHCKFGKKLTCKECDTKIKKKHYTYKKKEYLQELSGTRTCKKCEETKSLELFIEAPNCKFGRRLVCKECGEKGKKRYYKYEKKLSAEPPITRTCKYCKETKELELFTSVSTCRFGRSHACKECTKKQSKQNYQQLKQQLQ